MSLLTRAPRRHAPWVLDDRSISGTPYDLTTARVEPAGGAWVTYPHGPRVRGPRKRLAARLRRRSYHPSRSPLTP